MALYLLESNEAYNLYSVPVKLNDRQTNLRVAWDWEQMAFRIIGAWDGLAAGGASARDITLIQPGDHIIPLYEAYDSQTDEYLGLDEDVVYTAEAGFTLRYMQLPPVDYYYAFTLRDLYGLNTNTDFVRFSVDEAGELWFYPGE